MGWKPLDPKMGRKARKDKDLLQYYGRGWGRVGAPFNYV